MINPTRDQLDQIAQAARHYPGVLQWLESWTASEVQRLPSAGPGTLQKAAGRCSVLQEVAKTFKEAPTMVAKAQSPASLTRTPEGA